MSLPVTQSCIPSLYRFDSEYAFARNKRLASTDELNRKYLKGVIELPRKRWVAGEDQEFGLLSVPWLENIKDGDWIIVVPFA